MHNLKTLFGIQEAPSDTCMRERLDELDPNQLAPAFKKIFAITQRGKDLEPYAYLNGKYLVSIDATGHFSSSTIHCENCCVKNHQNGSRSYQHQMLCAVMVHPHQKPVIVLGAEPMGKCEGQTKNDCERNAAKRLLPTLRRHHPHLGIIVVEDSLYANGPHLRMLEELQMDYILGVKPGDHPFLFDWLSSKDRSEFAYTDSEGMTHRFSFINQAPLNEAHSDLKVNFLEYWQTDRKGRVQHFTWITNFALSIKNVDTIMRGARARWRIENETFNTLKNQGYHFEHNFGHGKKHLCDVMGLLMLLAFLIDQVQLLGRGLYQQAKKEARTFSELWNEMRVLFKRCFVPSWESFLASIAQTQGLFFNSA